MEKFMCGDAMVKRWLEKVSIVAIMFLILALVPNRYVQATTMDRELESNDVIGNATLMSLNTPYIGKLNNSNDIDYYMFNLDNDGNVQIKFSHEAWMKDTTSPSWIVKILDSQNNEYGSIASTGSDTEKNFNIGLPKGTYYLKVQGTWSYLDIDYNIQAEYIEGRYYEKEYNNSQASATAIDLNTPYDGRLSSSSDSDYYKFQLYNPGDVQVKFLHKSTPKETTSASWTIKVLDSENNEYASLSSTGSEVEKALTIGLSQGTYYIKIQSTRDYLDIDYSVQATYTDSNYVEKEFNNTLALANPVEQNTPYTGRLSDSNDVDYYRFTTDNPGNVQVKFSHASTKYETSSPSWNVKVVDSKGSEYCSFNSSGSDTEKTISVGVPAGTYYIKIQSAWNYMNLDYSIETSFRYDDYYEKEFNDSEASANTLELNTAYTGALNGLSSQTDRDYYKFTLDEAKEVTIKFEHDLIPGIEESPIYRVKLMDQSNKELYNFLSKSKDTQGTFTIRLDKGYYFLKVEGYLYNNELNKEYKISCNIRYDSSRAKELVQYALNQKNFYGFNIAYAEVMKIPDDNERNALLSNLGSISDIVWTDDIKRIYADLRSMAETGSAQIYDSVQIKIDNSNLQQVDKDYLKTEVTSWGKALVWTEDYKIAVNALLNAYSKKDAASIGLAETKINSVKNKVNKAYLMNELKNFKNSIK